MPYTLIFYHLPQDKETHEQPNSFGIPKPLKEIRIQQIKQYFPLIGEYIFRFRYKNKQNKSIWLDITNKKVPLPQFSGIIQMKVLRKSWNQSSQQNQQRQQQPKRQSQQQNQQQQNVHQNINLLGNQEQKVRQPQKQQQNTEFNIMDDNSEEQKAQRKQSDEFSLF